RSGPRSWTSTLSLHDALPICVVRAVVRDLKEQGLELPTRVTAKERYGSLIWKVPTLSAVIRILHNPAYAGAYVYGRWEYLSERRDRKSTRLNSSHVSISYAVF